MAQVSQGDEESTTSDDTNLRAGIADLAGLVAGSRPLPELLADVAMFAAHAIPHAAGAGVALVRVDGGEIVVEASAASGDLIDEIDRIQYGTLHEGPCITAARRRHPVHSESLGGDPQWLRFGPRAGRLGIHSVLALPLVVDDQVVGAIGVYSHAKNAFDRHALEFAELFAAPAAVAMHNARVLAQALAMSKRLQSALASRPVIDQAVGVIRARTGRSAEEALDQLRSISQSEQRKLADVAAGVVDEAVRRARARQTP